MLIPLRHSQMSARRWPVITFALIAINAMAFLATNWTIEEQAGKLTQTKIHLLMLAAAHPELEIKGPAKDFVDHFQTSNPKMWDEIKRPDRPVEDAFDARMRAFDFMTDVQGEMDTLATDFAAQQKESLLENWAFVPAQHKPISYLTSMFLHGGWLHLIGNMWFLWLAGFVLEDAWGRPVYAAVYIISGVLATLFYLWTNPGSIVPTLGASGAVAALMGAFLVRFPKLEIEMAWFFMFKLRRFKMAAYWLLPLWLLSEVFSGSLMGTSGGVAHWAHVGGFIAGAAIAMGLKLSGAEERLNRAVEAEVSVQAAPEILQANELLDANDIDGAIKLLEEYFHANPGNVDASMLLEQAYWRKGDTHAYCDIAVKNIDLYLKQNAPEAALRVFDDFVKAGGDREQLSPATWMNLCRAAENAERFDQALAEYKRLADAYPDMKQALQAQMAAAKLYLKKLQQPQSAIQLLEEASRSAAHHLDWQPAIDAALKEARAAIASPAASAAAAGAR